MQRGLHYAIVDEVDSILIDEARTPLIISGAAEDSSKLYKAVNELIPSLEKARYRKRASPPAISPLMRNPAKSSLPRGGHERVEELLLSKGLLAEGESLYSAANLSLLHHVHSALRAHHLFQKDVDYIVQVVRWSSLTSTPAVPCPPDALERRPAPGCGSQRRG